PTPTVRTSSMRECRGARLCAPTPTKERSRDHERTTATTPADRAREGRDAAPHRGEPPGPPRGLAPRERRPGQVRRRPAPRLGPPRAPGRAARALRAPGPAPLHAPLAEGPL